MKKIELIIRNSK